MKPLLLVALLLAGQVSGQPLEEGNKARQAECRVTLDGSEWPEYPPIMTRTNGELVKPEGDTSTRSITFGVNEDVKLACSEKEFANFAGTEFLTVTCVVGTTFDTPSGEMQFSDLGCVSEPSDKSRATGRSCDGGEEIEMGFYVEGGFYASLTSCFNEDPWSKNIYSYHTLYKEIIARDQGNDRPSFRTGGFFPFDVDDAYSQATQEQTIDTLTGRGSEYVSGNRYLARGHLSPNADFLYYALQDSTFYFVNAAPQWQDFNAGNWVGIEDNTREYVEDKGRDLTVYTGTNGVLALDDTNNNPVDIYLYLDSAGDRLPVPLYFWKVLVDENANTGIALIGVNNIYLSTGEISAHKKCASVSHSILNGMNTDDIAKGVVYACDVDDAKAVFTEMSAVPGGLERLPN